MKRIIILVLLVCTFLFGSFTATYAWASYVAQELGVPLGDWGAEAYSINSSGMTACVSRTSGGSNASGYLVYSDGSITSLGINWAMAVNDNGQVAGAIGQYSSRTPVVRDSSGHIINLQTPDWASDSIASGINNNGLIIGQVSGYNEGQYQTNLIIWDTNTGTYTVLSGGFSSLCMSGINDYGMASWSGYTIIKNLDGTKSTVEKAFVWDTINGPTELSKLADGDAIYTYGIDDAGHIVGLDIGLGSEGIGRAVIWDSSGNITALTEPSDGSYAIAKCINNSGQIAGQIAGQPVLWDLSGNVHYLPVLSGWYEVNITGINDKGQIAGQAYTNNGVRAVIWETVPEPSALFALGCGMLGIVMRRRR